MGAQRAPRPRERRGATAARPLRREAPVLRAYYDETQRCWWFSVFHVLQVIHGLPDFSSGRAVWKKHHFPGYRSGDINPHLRHLKMTALDGRSRETLMGTAETVLRMIQTERGPHAARIRNWTAKVATERLQEMLDPKAATRRIAASEKRLATHLRGQATPKELQYALFMSLLDPDYGRN